MRAEFDDRARRVAKELEGTAGGAGPKPGAPGVDVCNRVRAILGLPQMDSNGNEIEDAPGNEAGTGTDSCSTIG